MSIVNTTLHHGAYPPRVLLRHFHPTADFAGGIPAPTPTRLMVFIGVENHGVPR